jgi:hypothetical protein
MDDNDSVDWIDGIQDKSALPCCICGCEVDFIFLVTDSFWKKIIHSKYRLDVICLHCFDVLAKEKEEDISNEITDIFYCGKEKTMKLSCDRIYPYKERNKKPPCLIRTSTLINKKNTVR